MSPRLRLILLSPAFRWTVVALVLLAAGAIAFWPRQQPDIVAYRPPPSAEQDADTRDGANTRGAAMPCPETAPAGATKPNLGGSSVVCLGSGARMDAAAALAARDGKPTLVNVWASWCPPCRDELPVLQRYAQRADAVRVVGMQIDSPPEDGRALLSRLGVRLPTVFDPGERTAARLQVPYGLPASYLIDAHGRVQFVAEPRLFDTVSDVERAVRRYTPAGGHG